MSAPVEKTSGASVARSTCATGEFALRLKPAAQGRATAPLPVAQAQQAGFDHNGQTRASGANAAMQNPSQMETQKMNVNINWPSEFGATFECDGEIFHKRFDSEAAARTWVAGKMQHKISCRYEVYEILNSGGCSINRRAQA